MFAISRYLWVAPHILLLLVIVVLLRRRLHRQIPFFTYYAIFNSLQSAILYPIALQVPFPKDLYHWTAFVTEIVSVLLTIGVIYELASRVLVLRPSLVHTLRVVLSTSLAILILAAALSSAALHSISSRHVMNLLVTLGFFSHLVITGLLLTLFAFTRALKIRWPGIAAGIALGFGIYEPVNFFGAALNSAFGIPSLVPVDIIDMASFHVAVVWWLACLLKSKPELQSANVSLSPVDLAMWDVEAQRMVQ
jgi:hypothetical protein